MPLVLALAPGASLADLAGYVGTWCEKDGPELMHVDESGLLGFNEHTVCEWKGVVPDYTDAGFAGELSCRNVYVMGQNEDGSFQTVETEHQRGLDLTAEITGTDTFGGRYLRVIMSGWRAPVEFGPCG